MFGSRRSSNRNKNVPQSELFFVRNILKHYQPEGLYLHHLPLRFLELQLVLYCVSKAKTNIVGWNYDRNLKKILYTISNSEKKIDISRSTQKILQSIEANKFGYYLVRSFRYIRFPVNR